MSRSSETERSVRSTSFVTPSRIQTLFQVSWSPGFPWVLQGSPQSCLFDSVLLRTASLASRLPLVFSQASVTEGSHHSFASADKHHGRALHQHLRRHFKNTSKYKPSSFIVLGAGKGEKKTPCEENAKAKCSFTPHIAHKAQRRLTCVEFPGCSSSSSSHSWEDAALPPRWRKPLRSPINYLEGRCETQPLHLPTAA